MQRFFILLMVMFVCSHAGAQVQVTSSKPKSISKVFPLKNGKYGYTNSTFKQSDGRNQKVKSDKSLKPGNIKITNSENTFRQTYHIVFHFNVTDLKTVICNGINNLYLDDYNMYWVNENTLEADIEEGYYYLLCEISPLFDMPTYVVVKNFHVYKDMDTAILRSSAKHITTLNLHDENNDLINPSQLQGNNVSVTFEFPQEYLLQMAYFGFTGFGNNCIRFSDITEDIKISTYRAEVKKDVETQDGIYHSYVASFPALFGCTKDTVFDNQPEDYRQFTYIFHSSPAAEDCHFTFSDGWIANELKSDYAYFCFGMYSADYQSKKIDTCLLFASNVAVDTNRGFFISGIMHWEAIPDSTPDSPTRFIWSEISYISQSNDTLVLSSLGNYPPVKGDYKVPVGSVINFGNSSPFSLTRGYNSQIDNRISIFSTFLGQNNEERAIDICEGFYELWQGNLKLDSGSSIPQPIYYVLSNPDPATLILNDSNYSLLGRSGHLKSISTFDFNKSDVNAPTLTAMKILKETRISPELIHGHAASIEFTAGDFEFNGSHQTFIYTGLSDVRLHYKNSLDSLWEELPVSAHSDQLDSIAGLPFSADLESVLNQYPDSAWIDLRISLTDLAGNTNVQIIRPAFLIRDKLTSVDSKSEDCQIKVYPNPSENSITMKDPAASSGVS